jgi:two-component system KDP operon response regulator KdpE
MNNSTILVVDDEHLIRRTLYASLSQKGYDVVEARDGQTGIEALMRWHPDLILLDVNMPEMTGFETCRRMRLSFEGPIIMLTVRNSENDKIEAFDSGADDYVLKPFSMPELLARIQAALRRSSVERDLPKIETPDLKIDLETRIVNVHGRRVHLTPKEFEVLHALVREEGKAVTHRRILQAAWGPDYGEEIEKVRVVIRSLRKKIEEDPANPRYIVTEQWFGYRFQIPVEANSSHSEKA